MKTNRLVVIYICVLILVLSLSLGCKKAVTNKPVKIGVVLELTGALAPQGERTLHGMQIARDEINQNGGNLELKVEDSQTNPQFGLNGFNKLIDFDHVDAVTGGISSSVVMAIAPIANNRNIVFLSSGATSPSISQAGEFIYRLRLSGSDEVTSMATTLIKDFNYKTTDVVYVNNDYGTGNYKAFLPAYEGLGGKVIYNSGYAQGNTDFRSIIGKIKSSKSNSIYIIGHSLEIGQFLKQARELNLKKQIFSSVGVEAPEVIKIAGPAADGVIYTIQQYDTQTAEGFTEKYLQSFNEEPDLFAVLGYDAIKLLYHVSKDKKDGLEIKKALDSIKDFHGILGNINFDKNGDIVAHVMTKTIKDGKFIPYVSKK